MEKKILNFVETTVNNLGFNIIQIIVSRSKNTKIIKILIEHLDGNKISINDCQLVSRNISTILDVEDIISSNYILEISSAGINRPLLSVQDFKKYIHSEIKVYLKVSYNGHLSFRGKLLDITNDIVSLESKNIEYVFDFNNLRKAHLVFTEEMFRKLLNKT